MNKEYWLIQSQDKPDEEFKLIDKFVCKGIKEARKEFSRRNPSLSGCIIVKSELWYN